MKRIMLTVFCMCLIFFGQSQVKTKPTVKRTTANSTATKKPIEFYFDELPSIIWHTEIFPTSKGNEKTWTIMFPYLKIKGSSETFYVPSRSKNYTIDGQYECLFFSRIWFLVTSESDLNTRYTKGSFQKNDNNYDFCNIETAEDRFESSLKYREYLKREIPMLLNKITATYNVYTLDDFKKLKVEANSWDIKRELHKGFFSDNKYQFTSTPAILD